MKKAEEERAKKEQVNETPAKSEDVGQQFSMLNYAKLYFADDQIAASPAQGRSSLRNRFSLTKKKDKDEVLPVTWGWTELVKKIKHSKLPIGYPLTKIVDPEEIEIAIELFKGSFFFF